MAATVATIITNGRYDLRDTNSTQFADTELVTYLNRGLVQLDASLMSLKSDLIHATEESVDLASAANSVVAPSDLMSIRSVWIGSDRLIPKPVDYIYYKRKHISATGQPDYYAEEGLNIIFERTADQAYSELVIHYNKKSTALTTSGAMPFNDMFNEPLRQTMVMLAKARQEYDIVTDGALLNYFMDAAMTSVITRNYTQRRYKMDF